MNDLLQHEQYVTENPEDRTAARALIDHHEDALGVPHRVAVRAVARIKRAARNAREISGATNLLTAESWVREELLIEMLLECDEWQTTDRVTTLVVAGSRPPYVQAVGYGPDSEPANISIVVGARWVLRQARFDALRRGIFKHNFGHPEPGAPAE